MLLLPLLLSGSVLIHTTPSIPTPNLQIKLCKLLRHMLLQLLRWQADAAQRARLHFVLFLQLLLLLLLAVNTSGSGCGALLLVAAPAAAARVVLLLARQRLLGKRLLSSWWLVVSKLAVRLVG